ncbi:MAG: hypothetical protein ACYSTS_04075 [Planctomycetota bacterium]|jgi:hypothetical protein
MANYKNVAGDNDRKKIIKLLSGKTQTMHAHGNEIQKAMKSIIKSCHKQGTKGDAHKNRLLALTEEMKGLVSLYRSAEKRYESVAMKLEGGSQENKLLTDLLGYIVFCNDQIKSEQKGYKRIINMLRN